MSLVGCPCYFRGDCCRNLEGFLGYEDIFDAPPGGVFRGRGDAYYLMLEPLPPGQHELRLTSSVFQEPGSECNSSSDVTYQINVK
jgi:hypothetical protein